MPGQRRDPYLRAWMKIPTGSLEQDWFNDLSAEELGVFLKSLLWSTRNSYDIGYFLDRYTAAPLNVDAIARRIRSEQDAPEQAVRTVLAAFETFVKRGVFTWDEANGYAVAPEIFEQFLNENNIEKKRQADAQRQRKSKAVRKARQTAETKVVSIHRERDLQ